MKKILVIALASILALTMVACGKGSASIKDGTYSAEFKNLAHGWKDSLSVTYKGGVIENVVYDAINADGNKKSATADEDYGMEAPALSEWMPILNENIKAAGTADKIEAVAGATSSSNAAKTLMAEVEKKAKAGDTTPAIVDNQVSEG